MNQDREQFLRSYVLNTPEFKELFLEILKKECGMRAYSELEAIQRLSVINFIQDLLEAANYIANQNQPKEE